MPSDQEIDKVRSLISRLRRHLDELPPETRNQVDDAICQLRITRNKQARSQSGSSRRGQALHPDEHRGEPVVDDACCPATGNDDPTGKGCWWRRGRWRRIW